MSDDPLESALEAALRDLDDAIQIRRQERQGVVDTLSHSLAAPPSGLEVALLLHRAASVVETENERDAFMALVRVARGAELITEAVATRLLKDVSR